VKQREDPGIFYLPIFQNPGRLYGVYPRALIFIILFLLILSLVFWKGEFSWKGKIKGK